MNKTSESFGRLSFRNISLHTLLDLIQHNSRTFNALHPAINCIVSFLHNRDIRDKTIVMDKVISNVRGSLRHRAWYLYLVSSNYRKKTGGDIKSPP